MIGVVKKFIKAVLKVFGLKITRDPAPPRTFSDIDEEYNELYDHAQEMTQMKGSDNILRRRRHHTLAQLLKNILPEINRGNIAECGCWRGLSAYQIAYHVKKRNFKNRFFVFDSFEGLSDFKDEDMNKAAEEERERRKKWFACSQEIVESNLKEFSFIDFKKGWIPERFGEVSNMKFIFVHIDLDLYQPIKDSLEFFYSRTLPGGIMVFDDYGCLAFPGARQAIDEFMKDKDDFFMHLPSGEAFIRKK